MLLPMPATDPFATPYLDPDHVRWVVDMPDPLARNAAITRGYHALSEAVAEVLGRDHANWLTFGQWASAEARRSIDGEAVPVAFRPFVLGEVERAVAAGNAAIFGDVAPPFIHLVRTLASAGDLDALALRGEVLQHVVDPQHTDLARALGAYADAWLLLRDGDPDPKRRAERMLVANVSVGAHEQRLADPFVRAAIPGRWIAAVVATSHMGLRLPEGELRLDRDVAPPAYLGGRMFPPLLEELSDPAAIDLAERFGQELRNAAASDALDWESYDDRMGFIFTLLRAHQCDPTLFPLPPGTPTVG
jgi:hypothetical protein